MWTKGVLAAAVALLATPIAWGATATPAEPEPTASPELTIEGTIGRITGNQLWLQDPQGAYYPVKITPQLDIESNGRRVALRQLPFGTPVRATARIENGQQVAQHIDVQPTPPVPQLPNPPRR